MAHEEKTNMNLALLSLKDKTAMTRNLLADELTIDLKVDKEAVTHFE